MSRVGWLFVLLGAGCITVPSEADTAAALAPAVDQFSDLSRLVQRAALDCDLGAARVSYEQAKALCGGDCTPEGRATLEAARVTLALRSGASFEATLREAALLAVELEREDAIAGLSLLAELARWKPSELGATAERLERLEPLQPKAAAVALKIASEPSRGAEIAGARGWWTKYELSRHQWRAEGTPAMPDNRYSAEACPESRTPAELSGIPGLRDFIHSQRGLYERCFQLATLGAPAGSYATGAARVRIWVDETGKVTQLDGYGAFLPESLVACLDDALKANPVPGVSTPGLDEVAFTFLSH